MHEQNRRDKGSDRGMLMRWGVLVVLLGIGGLLLASRAADAYTEAVGFLLTGFGLLLGFRLALRVSP